MLTMRDLHSRFIEDAQAFHGPINHEHGKSVAEMCNKRDTGFLTAVATVTKTATVTTRVSIRLCSRAAVVRRTENAGRQSAASGAGRPQRSARMSLHSRRRLALRRQVVPRCPRVLPLRAG